MLLVKESFVSIYMRTQTDKYRDTDKKAFAKVAFLYKFVNKKLA